MSSKLKVNNIIPSTGTQIGISTTGGGINLLTGTVVTGIVTASGFDGPITQSGDFTIDDYIVHAGDTNTKFGFSAADTISFETAGSERLHIASNGKVRIGNGAPNIAGGDGLEIDTGGPATVRLEDSGAGSSFEIQNTGGVIKQNMYNSQPWTVAYNSSEKFRIKSDGSVGVGTVSPDETLELWKASGTNLVKVSTQANSTIGIELEKTGATTQSWRIADGQTVNGTLEFYDKTEGETRLAIDGSARVIIGQASHNGGGALVVCGNSNTPNAYASATFCKIGANPTSGTTLTNLRFNGGSAGTNRAAEINVKCDANWSEGSSQASKMELGVADSGGTTANTPSLTLKAGGNVEINRGNLVIAATKGIDFGAQTASSATGATTNHEVLDHYEEGDWTPSNAHISVSNVYSARYVKVGKIVHISFAIMFASSPSDTAQTAWIDGLPFQAHNKAQYITLDWTGTSSSLSRSANTEHVIFANSSRITFYYPAGAHAQTRAHVAGKQVRATFTYLAST